VIAVLLALAIGSGPTPQWDPARVEHLEKLARLLERHVAYLEVEVEPVPRQPLAERERSGFGAVIDTRLVATSYAIAERAKAISIQGPNEKRMPGKIVLLDADRRLALVEAAGDLSAVGLAPAPPLEKAERRVDTDVFALVSTVDSASVVHGVLLDETAEAEGHPRTSLELTAAMPVFDGSIRLVGLARAVAWDTDKKLVIPPEMISQARTATAASRASEPRRDSRPWWAK
jgi:hypothetical protein